MARIARAVVPGTAHHITQRGNRRGDVFFSDADRRHLLELEEAEDYGWSNAAGHTGHRVDPLLSDQRGLLSSMEHWSEWLRAGEAGPVAQAKATRQTAGK